MTCKDLENIKLYFDIDDTIVYEFKGTINEEKIVETAKFIEEILKNNNAKPKKMQDVFEVLVEVMQNILNYSSDTIVLDENRRESHGILLLSYKSDKDRYILKSCNEINKKQKSIISDKLKSLEGLDNKALRKLAIEKMRSKEDTHHKGAGLGFIMMARKSVEPIEATFIPSAEGDTFQYILKLVI